MSDFRNLEISQVLIRKGLLQIQTLELCMQIQKNLLAKGEKKELEDILLQNKFIKEEDLIKAKNYLVLKKDIYVPNYLFLSKLGEGGMGSVYKGLQISLERPVAIKLLDPSLGNDSQFVKRFSQEAKLLAKLDHPNIVKGIDFGESQGYYYYVMEYLKGLNISELVFRDGALKEKVALNYAVQIAKALEHASEKGLVHRDVKPENILICEDDEKAKLCDLGLARWNKSKLSLTCQGAIVGTPYYLSPEQAQGQLEIDIRSDIYSLGATLYFMLTGKPPYEGEMATVVHFRHIYDPPPVITNENKNVSEWLDEFFQEIMAKDVNKRIQTPSEVIIKIKEYQMLKGKTSKKSFDISKTPRPQKTPHPVLPKEKTSTGIRKNSSEIRKSPSEIRKGSSEIRKSSSGAIKKTLAMPKMQTKKTLAMKQIEREEKCNPKKLLHEETIIKNEKVDTRKNLPKPDTRKNLPKPDTRKNLQKTSQLNKIERRDKRKTLVIKKIDLEKESKNSEKISRSSQLGPAYKKSKPKLEKQKKIIIWSLSFAFFLAILFMLILIILQTKN